MTAEEIRTSENGESMKGNEIAYWLREIAAQLAEANALAKLTLRGKYEATPAEVRAELGKM